VDQAPVRRLPTTSSYAYWSARATTGSPLTRARREELPSEGIVRGAVQVPPEGGPVLFLADHR
jgi:allophanate hydrolase subunit 2